MNSIFFFYSRVIYKFICLCFNAQEVERILVHLRYIRRKFVVKPKWYQSLIISKSVLSLIKLSVYLHVEDIVIFSLLLFRFLLFNDPFSPTQCSSYLINPCSKGNIQIVQLHILLVTSCVFFSHSLNFRHGIFLVPLLHSFTLCCQLSYFPISFLLFYHPHTDPTSSFEKGSSQLQLVSLYSSSYNSLSKPREMHHKMVSHSIMLVQ